MPDTRITIAEARARVLAATFRLGEERVGIDEALDRVLARDVRAAGDVPPFPCSAMDGYAVKAGPAERTLTVVGESQAGAPSARRVGDGEAIRISTGAAIPDGAEAVIRQEDVERRDARTTARTAVAQGDQIKTNAAVDEPDQIKTNAAVDGADQIQTTAPVAEGENVREAGDDMRAGTTSVVAGTILRAAELGAVVAAGAGEVSVSIKPRVSILSTGDELRAPGEPLGPGEIHNSNAPMLAALAIHAGAIAAPAQRLPDDRAHTEAALGEALERSDVVLISGGVSVGPHDLVKPALAALGVEQLFWRVALRPGGPTWFGKRGGKLVFGLPGNPVSAFVTFSLFARPALAALQGAGPDRMLDREATLGVAVQRNPRLEQAVRVRLERRDGATVAFPTGPQGSHILMSLLQADALALIPPGGGELEAGTTVTLESLPS